MIKRSHQHCSFLALSQTPFEVVSSLLADAEDFLRQRQHELSAEKE